MSNSQYATNASSMGPRKRQRTEETKGTSYRIRSHSPVRDEDASQKAAPHRSQTDTSRFRHGNTFRGRGSSYRPSQDNQRKGRNAHRSEHRSSPRPQQHHRNRDSRSASPDRDGPRNKKSKKERKENPSSRIHSLRKQLARGGLPPRIHQERERELAALLFEQQKTKIKHDHRKNLSRYHFIRFIERQKATRVLKQLKKVKTASIGKAEEAELEKKLHEAEVDLMYTQYAPLGDKYVSLYPATDSKTGEETTKPDKYRANWKLMRPCDMAILDPQQLKELQSASQDAAGLLDLNQRASGHVMEDGNIIKPPMWYEVEDAMKEEGLTKLEALRDRKPTADNQSNDLVLGLSSKAKSGNKQNPDWLTDDGRIDPADMDSESDEDMQDGGVQVASGNKPDDDNDDDDGDDDDDMSDGDGGFFERR